MRAVVRVGDPGIDFRWVQRRSLGGAFASIWLVVTIIGLGAMAAGNIGPVGWIEGWQLRTWGTASPILAVLPFIVLPFAPGLARLLPIDTAHPFRLGIQQAFSPTLGPRFVPTEDMRARRVAAMRRIATLVLAGGLVGMAAGVTWSWRASSAPVTAPHAVRYVDLVGGHAVPTGTVLVLGATERQPTWLQQTQVRGTTMRSAWRAIAPAQSAGPSALVEKIAVGTGEDGKLHAYARPALVGHLHPLADWTAARLREAGFALTDHPQMLERSVGDHGDAIDAEMPGMLTAMLSSVAAFMGGIVRWKTGQMM